ncbi:(Fe-S)-binding protein [Tuberibacillus sp. Marseille-P3662]|uniref:(Fe-S)-binding protein n=1 Tax=Tuberibacillus sp. Marseille-P3662 TaxID=1965358 RepID=UPI000A1CD940|nr:heterodisulfide reductase-related iron-sulfur binding cluster [Tuberibacillus sp. Marseille-P3662]
MNTLLLLNWLLFLGITGYGIYLFTHVVKTRYEFIKLGQKAEWDQTVKERLKNIGIYVFGQKKLLKDKKSGSIHVMMFYGFLLVQFGAIDLIWKGLDPGGHLPFGPIYPGFVFFQELVTLMILVAVVWAFYRRYVEKLVRLKRGFKAGLVLLFIAVLMFSVLFSNGMEMIVSGLEYTWTAPMASCVAFVFQWLPVSVAQGLFYAFWWVHLLTLLSFMIYVPQSKHAHLIFGPANVYLGRTHEVGRLKSIDFEDESQETFGVNHITEFQESQLIDLYACVECGRCTNVCPATGTGKMLSPMDLIVRLRDHLTEYGASVTSRSPWMPAYAFGHTKGNQLAAGGSGNNSNDEVAASVEAPPEGIIGNVITEEEIWACTTCRNCEDQCPVMNEHVDKIIDLRRYLVLTEGKMDQDTQRAMTNIERQGNPWGLSKKEREDWRDGRDDIEVKTVKEMKKNEESFDYLFWVGSMDSYDNRSQKIAQSFAKVMNEAGIRFAILGNKEKNSGDTPRRMGNEFLFQELAEQNIQTFEKNGVKKIVTTDPHAYNTFKNEYPEFGMEGIDVYHHTELIAEWIKDGLIKPKYSVNERITYHDSCYLGRYNEVYDPPRDILKAIPGVELVEMERNRETGMCCGAGGGLMWTEEDTGSRINVARTEQAIDVNPTVISSACPYCLTMMSDGTKAKEKDEEISTYDVAELVDRSLSSPEKAAV